MGTGPQTGPQIPLGEDAGLHRLVTPARTEDQAVLSFTTMVDNQLNPAFRDLSSQLFAVLEHRLGYVRPGSVIENVGKGSATAFQATWPPCLLLG
jgi:hypothetical protein